MNQIPIRLRLTLWYVLLMAVSFTAFGAFLYTRFQHSLMNTLDTTLEISVSQTIATFEIEEDLLEIGKLTFEGTGENPTGRDFAMRLLSQQGDVWDEYGPPPENWGQLDAGFSIVNSSDEKAWRVFTEPILDVDGATLAWVQAAQSTKNVSESLDDLRDQLILGIPLVLLLAGVGGYFLADRALRPIDTITRTAQTMEAGDLSQRIVYNGPPDEVGRLAQTFDQMLERLQAAFVRERRFTGDAAHELRTPLTALKGQIEIALSKNRQPEIYRNTLRGLSEQVERLIRLSSALLFLSRSDQGGVFWVPSHLNLGDLLRAISDQIESLTHEKDLQFETHIPTALPVFGDTDHLIRLFLNLLDNAVKYTPARGQISLRACQMQAGVQVIIQNSGPGIPAQHLPHLFERFYRVDADRSSQSGGSGLGLAIAQEIVRLHGGEICVDSQPEQGVTFTVWLPQNEIS